MEWKSKQTKTARGMASRETRIGDATGNKKAQEEGNHCLGSGCPPRPPLSPQSRAWERCGSTRAPWGSGQGGVRQGPCSVVDHSGSGPSGSTWAIIRPLLGLAAPWLCPERCSLPHQSELKGRWGLHEQPLALPWGAAFSAWLCERHWTTSSSHRSLIERQWHAKPCVRCCSFRAERCLTCPHGIRCLAGSQQTSNAVQKTDSVLQETADHSQVKRRSSYFFLGKFGQTRLSPWWPYCVKVSHSFNSIYWTSVWARHGPKFWEHKKNQNPGRIITQAKNGRRAF